MLKIVAEGDLWYLLGVILILYWLGKTYADERQKLVGGFIAIATFFAFIAYAFEHFQPRDAAALFHIAARALVTFGLSLGFSWIALALLVAIVRPTWEAVRRARERERQRQRDREVLQQMIRSDPPKPPPLPGPTFEERTQRVRTEYDAECAAIRSLGLDADEQKVALDQARQRLMRRLRELLP